MHMPSHSWEKVVTAIWKCLAFQITLQYVTVVQLDGAVGLISGMYYTNSICRRLLGLDTGCLITHQKW